MILMRPDTSVAHPWAIRQQGFVSSGCAAARTGAYIAQRTQSVRTISLLQIEFKGENSQPLSLTDVRQLRHTRRRLDSSSSSLAAMALLFPKIYSLTFCAVQNSRRETSVVENGNRLDEPPARQ